VREIVTNQLICRQFFPLAFSSVPIILGAPSSMEMMGNAHKLGNIINQFLHSGFLLAPAGFLKNIDAFQVIEFPMQRDQVR